MKIFKVLIFFLVVCHWGVARNSVIMQNDSYRITIPPNFGNDSFITLERIDRPEALSHVFPQLSVFYTNSDPGYRRGHIREGNSPVAAWQNEGDEPEIDLWKVGAWTDILAVGMDPQTSGKVIFRFDDHPLFTISLTIKLGDGLESPQIIWDLVPRRDGWYAVGFTGLEDSEPSELDFLYQPLVWTWKRFPVKAVLTPEAFATTAATFINKTGYTEGLAIDPSEIPYRFATFDNSRFGIALRSPEGKAQPIVIAPIPGGAESQMKAGQKYRFSCRYFLQAGDWIAGTGHMYKDIIGFKTERQNATVSLNQTMENMIALAMDDVYSGWVADLKGSDYRFDVPGTVKNVSALHPLSVALTSGNLEIYRRRALPMIEYVLSREKYLYAVNDEITQQNPSHFLKGPCVEIGELAGLDQMTGGVNSVFGEEAERVFGKSRQLNLITETGGGSWQDYLARYRISGEASHLQKAVETANAYLDASDDKYPEDFTTSAGLKDLQATFVTDYTLAWYDLLELYEETGEERFRDAAITGATQMLLWMRSNPIAPDSVITANEGGRIAGVFPGRRHTANSYEWKEYDTSTEIQEQKIPAWRTSFAGLLPEVPYTYMHGPIMLAHHAAWMLRLAHLAGDPIFKDGAYNAVIGRYANFPGYYFTSMHTTVYQQPDYPLHPYLDIKYNAIFYNHIWPHIALLQDFLVSDAYLKSGGKVSFPSAYAPGYAFLTSKVYGHKEGEIFGNRDVYLWLPGDAIQSSSIALNHLFGRTEEDTYLVLMNTARETISSELYLNPDVIRWNKDEEYPIITYHITGDATPGTFKDGLLRVEVPAEGLIAIRMVGLRNDVPLQNITGNINVGNNTKNYFRKSHGSPALGTITGMLINIVPEFSDAYIYTDATEKDAGRVTIKYAVEGEGWVETTDDSYPYELSIHLSDPQKKLKLQWIAEDMQGSIHESEIFELSN